MNVLTTRALSYIDDQGTRKEVVLTIFTLPQVEGREPKCGFLFDPPINREIISFDGGDFILSFIACVSVARGHLGTTKLFGRLHWRGMLDFGLPTHIDAPAAERPIYNPLPDYAAGDMDVLSTRTLGCPDESGVPRELLLTVFVPFKQCERWNCGFAFGPPRSSPVYYGVGEDFIEALLDGLAMAREIFEGKVPEGWAPPRSGYLHDCSCLPYKIGRSFWTDPAPDVPGMP